MPSLRIDVAPAVIDWILQTMTDVNISNTIIDSLNKWKNGEKKPTFNQVESVSKATHLPLGYFFLESPPIENFPILQYRTIESLKTENPSRELIDTINDMENVQEWMRDYMIDFGHNKLHFVGSHKNETNKHIIAKHFRETLQIAPSWYEKVTAKIDAFKFFRSKLEEIGILVMMSGIVANNTHRSLNIEEFRAFTLIDDYAPLIFINYNDSQGAKLFSLLHEAVHIWIGISNFYNDRYGNAGSVDATETLCNAVAAEILVPSNYFNVEWTKQNNKELSRKIHELAKIFNCGVVVIARKALDNHYITHVQYQAVVDEAIQHFKDSRGETNDGNYYATASYTY